MGNRGYAGEQLVLTVLFLDFIVHVSLLAK